MLGDQPRRRRRNQAAVVPVGVERDVLQDEPHRRPIRAHQRASAGRTTMPRSSPSSAMTSRAAVYAAGGPDGNESARRINQFVGIRF